jgi:cytochrome c oxidase subunit 2
LEIALLAGAICIGIPGIMALLAIFSEREKVSPAPAARVLNRDTLSKASAITFAAWALLTVAGVIAVLEYDFYPTVASDKGEDIAGAFRLLTALAVPVAAMVIAILLYNVLRRGTYDLTEDGPAYLGRGSVPKVWFGATAALTLLVMIHPGMTALNEILDEPESPDLQVNVEGLQWTWLVAYPSEGVEQQRELVIPVDKTVRFNITSRDVLHSFWVPSLLMKIDAVPGRTTTISLRATKTGDFSSDPQVRLQCAELCGLGHGSMRIPVSVVTEREFRDWIQSKKRP